MRRRVLPWGALSHRELMGTARQRARQPCGVDVPPGWWMAAQVLCGWGVAPDGDPHGVLTGAVAAQVVAADLRAPSAPSAPSGTLCSVVPDRPWVAAVAAAADAVVSPSVVHRRRAGLRLLLALTEAAEGDPEVELGEAVAAILTARTPPEHRRAVVALTDRLDADPRRYSPVLASAWVLVFGPTLLGVLDEVSDQLGLLRTGKPPLRAAVLRRAQHTTVHQLHATGQVSTRALIGMAKVASGTIHRWIHHPPAVTLQGVGFTAAECAARGGVAPATWRAYVHRGQAPPARGGSATLRLWEESEVDTFLAHRPGTGCPHGSAPMTPRTRAVQARWQEGLTRLRAYAQAHGAANPHTRAVVDGFRLGRWAALQRERYWANRLPPEHIAALQGVPGWDWGRTNADRWAEGVTHLQSYLREHGTTAVDTRTVHEGFQLGAWVARRRANYHQGTLSPTRIAALEALAGWVWTRTEDRWPPGLKALRSYIKKHGTARVPLDATERRYPLGLWVAARRAQYKRGTLSPEQIATLQDLPGWVWDVKQARWEQGLRLLTAYAHRTGAPNPDSFYIEAAEDNFTLGAWAMSRRKEYRRGVLSPDRITALEAIDGWEWNPHDAAWHRMFAHLKRAAHHHGSVAHITQTAVIDGVNIGHWVMAQRTRHRQGRLTTERTRTLQALPGWDWAPHTAHQQPGSAPPRPPPP